MQCSLFREEFEMPTEFGISIPIQIPMHCNARGFWKFNTQFKYKYMVNENTRRGVAKKIYCSNLAVEYIHM